MSENHYKKRRWVLWSEKFWRWMFFERDYESERFWEAITESFKSLGEETKTMCERMR